MKSIFILLILISFKAEAYDTIVLSPNQYFIDFGKKIILSNKDVDQINTNWTSTKTHLSLDELYLFEPPVDQIVLGTAYNVKTIFSNLSFKLYFTELPIISINTFDAIVDEPDVTAYFRMIESNETYLESFIGIQYRGSWSQTLPKKSMEFKFWADFLGTDTEDHQLLNLVTNDSWNLQAMYNEPMRVRSKTNNDLWRMINTLHYQNEEPDAINGIRMKYIELFINNSYQGVYCLGEKVNRKQLKLKKHNGSIRGELYKGISWGNSTFTSLPPFDNGTKIWDALEYKHPKEEVKWESIYNFFDFVINASNEDFYQNYESKFEVDNLVDYYIFLNLLRATDNTGKNIFIAKYKANSKYFYVPWDLDGTFGIIWDGSNDNTTNDLLTNGFYNRLINDCSEGGFREKLKIKWLSLRESILTNDILTDLFNQNVDYLLANNVFERESLAWSDFSFSNDDLVYMTAWLNNRLLFLDDKFTGVCETVSNQTFYVNDKSFKIYPNPTTNYFYLKSDENISVHVFVYNSLGQLILNQKVDLNEHKIDLNNLNEGIYLVKIQTNKHSETHKLIVKK